MKDLIIEFITVDFWGRAVFKLQDKEVYFGGLDSLFPDPAKAPNGTKEEIEDYFRENTDEIVLFGSEIDCDPDGRRSEKWNFIIN